jgi:hypothetical protein
MELPITAEKRDTEGGKMRLRTACYRTVWVAGFICVLLTGKAYGQAAEDCSVSKPEDALAYLKQDRANASPDCARRAIETVSEAEYRPAIDTLFQYLDFTPVPPDVAPSADMSQPTGRVYPAADALFGFGKYVLPRVKQVIRDDDQSPLSRLNAAEIYFCLEPGPGSIRFIVKASRDSGSGEAHTKLIELAMKVVRYCPDEQRQACDDALNQ